MNTIVNGIPSRRKNATACIVHVYCNCYINKMLIPSAKRLKVSNLYAVIQGFRKKAEIYTNKEW